jgi:cyclophilin family peptidyl-prolyl cis-trans isomerase
VLIAGGCDEKELNDLAGIAFFATHDFDSAETCLREASRSGSISEQGSKFLASLDTTRNAWAEEQELRAAEAAADDLPRVKLTTSAGDIVLELFENEAPETVGNFVSLVEKGFYDGLTFHRVLQGFMAQAGCPKGDGSGGPGYRIYCECVNPNHRNHFRGSLSMAKETARHTGGSQFFICFVPTTHLDGEHTVFGRVLEGMDVLAEIERRDPSAAPPLPDPTIINKAEVLRKREHEYRPNKVK